MPTDPQTPRPQTGEEYLDSLRDGRSVHLFGERVRDVTRHPGFANAARTVARMYDSFHDGSLEHVMRPTDTGSGGLTHPFFRTPRCAEDLVADQTAIDAWARLSYGWMGRSPDYKASFLGTLGANAGFYAPYEENARTWYRRSQERVLFWNHAIVHPPVDRNRGADEANEVLVRAEAETDRGLVLSGAKVVATGAALSQYIFLAHFGLPVKDRRYAVVAAVPMDAPGVKLVSHTSHGAAAAVMGTPFDYPLSSRFDENDAVLLLDRAEIPWENVFIYGDVGKAQMFGSRSGFPPRFMFHGCVRLVVKLEFVIGVLSKALKLAGTSDFRGIQSRLGEVIAWRNLFKGLADAAARNPAPWVDGAVLPNPEYGMAYRWFMQVGYPRVREIILQDVASGLVYTPASVDDLTDPGLSPLLDTYLRGSDGADATGRSKVMKLLWDAMGSEFGGRHELYERNYGGNHEQVRVEMLGAQLASGGMDAFEALAEQCMADYDVTGWRNGLEDFADLRAWKRPGFNPGPEEHRDLGAA